MTSLESDTDMHLYDTSKGELFIGPQFCSETNHDGDNYTGYFLNGVKHGKGIINYKNGDCYDGLWKNNKRNGVGTFTFSGFGRKYKGGWKNDMRDGKGVITEIGSVYTGEMKENKKHGQGVHKHGNGMIYIGTWDKDTFIKGTIKWPDGRIYNGDHSSIGVGREGHGTYTKIRKHYCDEYVDREPFIGTYTGQWHKDKRNGDGRMLWDDGISYEGEWENDEMHGEGTFIIPNKDKYVGCFSNGKKHGKGTLFYPDGITYEGEWILGKKQSVGTFTWPGGRKFIGEWVKE